MGTNISLPSGMELGQSAYADLPLEEPLLDPIDLVAGLAGGLRKLAPAAVRGVANAIRRPTVRGAKEFTERLGQGAGGRGFGLPGVDPPSPSSYFGKGPTSDLFFKQFMEPAEWDQHLKNGYDLWQKYGDKTPKFIYYPD